MWNSPHRHTTLLASRRVALLRFLALRLGFPKQCQPHWAHLDGTKWLSTERSTAGLRLCRGSNTIPWAACYNYRSWKLPRGATESAPAVFAVAAASVVAVFAAAEIVVVAIAVAARAFAGFGQLAEGNSIDQMSILATKQRPRLPAIEYRWGVFSSLSSFS